MTPVACTPPVWARQRLALLWLASALGLVACDDLEDFRTGPGEAFVGQVTGNEVQDAGEGRVRPFLLEGFANGTRMELTFDPDKVGTDASPGRIHTFVCDDGSGADCDADARQAGPIADAPLVSIESLQHDVLSKYDFPGANRLRNYIFHVPVTTPDGGRRYAMAFVSLMESGGVEVRIVGAMANPDGAPRSMFGVFRLGRRSL